uniref:Solute carrier family 12 member 2-like n=1 Tax=Saccoglossus kowalevskii TaxID=10224 RepID=A0ABM0M1K2_SACKO
MDTKAVRLVSLVEIGTEFERNLSPASTRKNSVDKKPLGRFHVEFVSEKPGDKPLAKLAKSLPRTSKTSVSESDDDYPGSPRTPASPRNWNLEDSIHMRTFGHNTHEAVPSLSHYRNIFSTSAADGVKSRPTLQELHEEKQEPNGLALKDGVTIPETDLQTPQVVSSPLRFGWIKGVLVRCLLNIWGVMLFLRLSWVVGQAGIVLSVLIILLSAVVTVLTTLSMSAICTNGEVKGGGAYYMISRSLGPEFGGAIGLIFSMANAVAIAMYVVGFAETVKDLLKEYDAQIVDDVNDVRIIGVITVILILGIALVGMAWEARDAQSAIPKGTLLSILISTAVYIGMAIMLGSCIVRESTGIISDIPGGNFTKLCEYQSCDYGLLNDMQVVQTASAWGPIIIAGIFSATLSSALASMVGAPKVFQAVCKDKIFPKIYYFAEGTGANNEPRRAYILTFFIALSFILIGELNAIAPIISNFFLMSYALINFSCFLASLTRPPGWRPAFVFYNMWLALVASLLCIAVMFMINWWAALITKTIVIGLYLYVNHTKPEINWGSSTQAFIYTQSLQSTLKLNNIPEHVKNFRPQCLVLTGAPNCRPALVHFVSHLTKNTSLMVCGHVLQGEQKNNLPQLISNYQNQWLKKERVKAFYSPTCASNLLVGVESLMQLCGLGKMRTNTLFLGFKNNWLTDDAEKVEEYVNIIHSAFDLYYAVCILRIKEGLDISAALEDIDGYSAACESTESKAKVLEELSESDEDEEIDTECTSPKLKSNDEVAVPMIASSTQLVKGEQIRDVIKTLKKFQEKQGKGTIDVWWLFDDGGLTLLIPYLISLRSQWDGCKLRVFTSGKRNQIDRDKM